MRALQALAAFAMALMLAAGLVVLALLACG